MAISYKQFNSREEWLENRKKYIGGSDVASIIGLNPWKTNIQLWLEKTGRVVSGDCGDNPFVVYGTNAEKYLRDLFALDYPEFKVSYFENNAWTNDKYPFASASLDGWLTDQNGRKGILEIKTATISSVSQREKWKNRVPDNYYCQVLFYMAICEADFAYIKAQLKTQYGDEELSINTKHYKIERSEVQQDIDLLMEKAERFYRNIVEDKEPALIINI